MCYFTCFEVFLPPRSCACACVRVDAVSVRVCVRAIFPQSNYLVREFLCSGVYVYVYVYVCACTISAVTHSLISFNVAVWDYNQGL